MSRLITILSIVVLTALAAAAPSTAVEPDEMLSNPALEERAREISADLRCVVCQNQSIDDSDADIARDMRLLVRERLVAGDSDTEVVNYIVTRYGDFVLLHPPFQPNTLALWLAPPIMAVVIAILSVMFFRAYQRQRAAGSSPDPLSPADRAELDALVDRIAASTPPETNMSKFWAELENAKPDPDDPDPQDDEQETGDGPERRS